MKDSPVRLEDIARRAGVSKNTVSIALRNKPGVSEKRRSEIQRIAEEMGYRPNPMVAALMHNLRALRPPSSTNNIAFLHYFHGRDEWKAQVYCRELYKGIEHQCARTGFSASVVWGAEPGLNPDRLHEMLLNRGVSGVIFAPVPDGRRHVRLDCSDFALATVGYSLWRPAFNRACSHMRHAVRVAVRNLRKLGYQRIGVAWYPGADARMDYAATSGWATAQAANPKGLCEPFKGNAHVSNRFPQWLVEQRPDAIVNAGSYGMRDRLAELGVSYPREIGYVELVEVDSESAGIATVVRDWHLVGRTAVDIITSQLMQNIRGIPATRRTILVEGHWKPGKSVRKLR